MIEFVLNYYENRNPVVVVALCPPYYPGVNNSELDNAKELAISTDKILSFAKEELNKDIEVQNYFTGISDLSYGMFNEDDETIDYIVNNTPWYLQKIYEKR